MSQTVRSSSKETATPELVRVTELIQHGYVDARAKLGNAASIVPARNKKYLCISPDPAMTCRCQPYTLMAIAARNCIFFQPSRHPATGISPEPVERRQSLES